MEIEPNYANAHHRLGLAVAGQDKYDEAIKHFNEALRIKPDYLDSINSWAMALKEQGKVN